MVVVMVSINFSWISHDFDAFVGVQIKKVTKKYWWQYCGTVTTYPLTLLLLSSMMARYLICPNVFVDSHTNRNELAKPSSFR